MKKLLVIVSLVLALTSTNSAFADPKPLGFELGKATIEDVQNTYKTTDAGISAYTEGKMLNVDAYEVGLQDLQKVLFIFNPEGTLSVVDMTFRRPSLMNSTVSSTNNISSLKSRSHLLATSMLSIRMVNQP